MCSTVIIGALGPEDVTETCVHLYTPIELEDYGIPLIDIDDEYREDCWCCSDPILSLTLAGYHVTEDLIWGDVYAVKKRARPSKPPYKAKKPIVTEEECSYTL